MVATFPAAEIAARTRHVPDGFRYEVEVDTDEVAAYGEVRVMLHGCFSVPPSTGSLVRAVSGTAALIQCKRSGLPNPQNPIP